MAGVPIIVHTYHGHVFHGYFGTLRTKGFLAIERILGWFSTRVIAISDSQFRDLCLEYRVAPQKKFVIIYNGFDLERFSRANRDEARKILGLLPGDFVVVWAGRMVPIKDMQLLAEVIRRAAAKQKRICFLVVGYGTEKLRFESLIRGCNNVKVLAWRQDMVPIWSAADAAIVTSYNEGTPAVLIEAMAAGRPFVSTKVGGVTDLAVGPLEELPDGMGHKAANGFLTSRSPEAFLYCLDQIANNPLAASQMASAGRAFVLSRFSSDRLIQEMTMLYHTLLRGKGGRFVSSDFQERSRRAPRIEGAM